MNSSPWLMQAWSMSPRQNNMLVEMKDNSSINGKMPLKDVIINIMPHLIPQLGKYMFVQWFEQQDRSGQAGPSQNRQGEVEP